MSRRSTLSALVRVTLAFALALTLLPVAGSTARAQTGGDNAGEGSQDKARTLYGARPANRGFVIYSADGGTSCRVATPDEMQTLFAEGEERGLRQINHLEDVGNINAPGTGVGPNAQTNLKIILRATQQLANDTDAEAAFIRAAARWEERILSPITIVIDVDYGPQFFGQNYPAGVIGQTGGQDLLFPNNYTNIRASLQASPSSAQEQSLYNALPASSVPTDLAAGSLNDVSAASPILRAVGEVGAHADTTIENDFFGDAPKIGFNSSFQFDFNPDDGISFNRIDFDGVATHEIGHVLGFNSDVGAPPVPISETETVNTLSIWDFFRFSTSTITNFTTQQRTLRTTSGNHFEFNGNASRHQLSTGDPEGNGGDENQASHWKDAPPNSAIGIMDPNIANGERSTITDNDLRALDAMGYRVVLLNGTQPELPLPAAPSHDNIANAKVLHGNSLIDDFETFSSRFATSEDGEPGLTFNYGPGNTPLVFPARKSVWYKWTATAPGTSTVYTNGSNYDTVLAVYTGAPGSLTLLASNDDIGGSLSSTVQFTATVGTTYYIYMDGFLGAGGNARFNWRLPGAAPADQLQFASATASVTEGTNKVDLELTRPSGSNVAATVNYATSDGTAIEGDDYVFAQGTVSFAEGETSKTISVFIIDDAYGEGPETFTVTLSNPVNAQLGATTTSTVTITSNEASNGPNPMRPATFNASFFVRQHYLDFLGREPDAGGLAFWTNQLTNCENPPPADPLICRINVSAAFFLSIEFQETGYLVHRGYKASFGDATGQATQNGVPVQIPVPFVRFTDFLKDSQLIARGVIVGTQGWPERLEANKANYFFQFVQRADFISRHGQHLTPAQYVDALNANVGGALDATERAEAIALFGGAQTSIDTTTRGRVLRRVAEDQTFNDAEKNRAFVLMQFFGYLRRNPNDAPDTNHGGFNFWRQKLDQFNGNFITAEMVKAFLESHEYLTRFGQ